MKYDVMTYGMTYEIITFDAIKYEVMTYDVLTSDVMTYDIMTHNGMTYNLMTNRLKQKSSQNLVNIIIYQYNQTPWLPLK